MDTSIQVSIPTDADGFVTQECSTCYKQFKVVFGGGSEQPIAFCPYCGRSGQEDWWTKDQIEYFSQMASREIVAPMLKNFVQEINHMNRPNSMVTTTAQYKQDPNPIVPQELESAMKIIEFGCCNEQVKVDESETCYFCIICGKEQ